MKVVKRLAYENNDKVPLCYKSSESIEYVTEWIGPGIIRS